MILLWLIMIPLAGGIASLSIARRNVQAARWLAVAVTGIDLVLTASLWIGARGIGASASSSRWLYE